MRRERERERWLSLSLSVSVTERTHDLSVDAAGEVGPAELRVGDGARGGGAALHGAGRLRGADEEGGGVPREDLAAAKCLSFVFSPGSEINGTRLAGLVVDSCRQTRIQVGQYPRGQVGGMMRHWRTR